MKRQHAIFLPLLITGLVAFSLNGCSSSDDKKSDELTLTDGLDSPELADDGSAAAGTEDILADLGDGQEAPLEELPQEALDQGTGEIIADQPPALSEEPQGIAVGEPYPMDTAQQDAFTNEESFTDDMPMETAASEPAPVRTYIPLKKVKDAPFSSHGRVMNTVYVGRDGDNIDSVAEKLLGSSSKKDELISDNSFLSRGVKVGDKIYYNSPRRPGDSTTMLTYYEDQGMVPQSYVSKDGENIRVIAKNLLGYNNAWKEIWATNSNVESKGDLPAGTELRYWPANVEPVMPIEPQPEQQMAEIAPPPPPAPEPMVPEELPTQDLAQNNNGIDDMDDGAAAGTLDLPPPPPPPPSASKAKPASSQSFLIQDQETTMMLGVGAILFLTVILLVSIVIRRSRAKKMKFGT